MIDSSLRRRVRAFLLNEKQEGGGAQVSKGKAFGVLAAAVLVLLFILVFPLRYALVTVDEKPEGGDPVKIGGGDTLEQTITPPANGWSGLVLRADEIPGKYLSSVLELRIFSNSGFVEERSLSVVLADVYDKESRTITFNFPSIPSSKDHLYRVNLSMANGGSQHPIFLRPPISDLSNNGEIKVGYQLLVSQSVWEILSKELYSAKAEGEDIYHYWRRGGQVVNGVNPYACVIDDSCVDHKIPIHLPLFYWLSAASLKVGFASFEAWIALWRPTLLALYVATGFALFITLARRNQLWLAFFALFFWLFNRWSLYVIRVGHVDFMALFFLVLSVVLVRKYWRSSLLLLGVSLAIKQVAVFIVPLYLIIAWSRNAPYRWRAVTVSMMLICVIPFAVSLPFLLDQPKAMVTAVLFSVTRDSEANLGAPSIDSILQIKGVVSMAFMAMVMLFVYMSTWRHRLSLASASLLILISFLAFNSVTFNQYFLWAMPFVPLAISDQLLRRSRPKSFEK